jgi:hypothetical protein
VDLSDHKEEKHVDEPDDLIQEDPEDHSLVLTEPVARENTLPSRNDEEDGQSLVQTIVMIIGGIILVILLVLFARWIYHAVHHSDQTNTVGINQAPQEPSSPSTQSGNNQPSNNTGNSGSSNSSTQNQPITNTGPGNVAAIFAGSTLAAAGLHYIISLRKQSREN